MKRLIAVAFVGAGCCGILSHARVLSATSLLPSILFASALILTLLHVINIGDRRY
jgi:hypothetical protein